ncbi:HAD-IA family hydrolase [Sinorhizobium sp. BG8]|uniref:HAD-IA family hydrolase n=1 Tax=Sinorhizobium sp. BG8 TaxID=2613773 RepID=UPI00193E123B|nr:HAD-IA family hydrolase [Sinorhizobium sp. BG8]QRM56939.1 HAD-IA family hydrolase [Sinorhizobium sp. BG8]
MRLVLFDCDGTLVDSAALIHEVMSRSFAAFGHALPTYEGTKSIIGLTLDIAIARLQGKAHVDSEAQAMAAHYKSIYTDVRADTGFQEPLFGGISEMMRRLEGDDGLILGAVTGKSRRGLNLIRTTHGFDKTFFVSRTADDCPSKPHPAMVTECCSEAGIDADRTLVVGDAIYDMQMAKAAGATAIGVSWGYASVDDLVAAGADHILDVPADLLAWLEVSDV